MTSKELPVPTYFDSDKVGTIWKVDYDQRAKDAEKWRERYDLQPAAYDRKKILLFLVDVQNSFCTPGFELFVAGRSGKAAVEDNKRLCKFIYRNLNFLTEICLTMDTHQAMQVFHPIFLVDKNGDHPEPFTIVNVQDVEQGVWRFNENISPAIGVEPGYGQRFLLHYVKSLSENRRFDLTIWPYHAMLGGIGHSLVPSVEEAVYFHGIARSAKPDFQVKGENPFTEKYSVLSPEVFEGPESEKIGEKNKNLIKKLLDQDAVIIAGQAKSHCVAWTIADLLGEIKERNDPSLAEKIYILEDCTSSVVIPDVVDYTQKARETFKEFAEEGMRIVRSTEPVCNWKGICEK